MLTTWSQSFSSGLPLALHVVIHGIAIQWEDEIVMDSWLIVPCRELFVAEREGPPRDRRNSMSTKCDLALYS
jgi:hypothetical protein